MIKERNEIDARYKWDLSVIYQTEADFEAEYAAVKERIRALSAYEDTLTESAETLTRALDEKYAVSDLLGKLWRYASLGYAVNTADTAAQAKQTRVHNLFVLMGEVAWFFGPRIRTLREEQVSAWMAKYPPLSAYARVLHRYLRFRPHALGEEEEQLLSELGDAFDSHEGIFSLLTNADLRYGSIRGADGKRAELSPANYVLFMKSPDRRVRRAAFRTMYRTVGQFANTLAALYEARIKEEVTEARIRKYPDSITASTDKDEVTPAIYNNLIESVHGALPALYEYYALKRETLGLKALHLYDVYTPLVPDCDRTYTYEEAIEEVLASVRVLGDEYVSILREGLCERGWADVFPSRGKRGGAFSASGRLTEPYILMNFNGDFAGVSTLAHEAGHSMHSYHSRRANPTQTDGTAIFIAEVASTVNELLLVHRRLAESTSREEKLMLLGELAETYKGTLFRQTMFAEFERDMHAMCEAGTPLTKDAISEHYYALNRLYFGENVVCDREIAYEWARIPHFYSCFYVYKYATCISAASAIVKRIESEGAPYVKKYLDFLSAGDSRSPMDCLRLAEIDLERPEVIQSAIEDFRSAVAQLRALLAEA